ncbi:hypothetical protein [Pedobacter steynii]|nr:hypothetical protein [Pedobacter steynii]
MLKEVNITAQKKSTSSANLRGIKKYFDAHNGDIGNYLAGGGYVVGAVSNWAGNVIKSRSLYGVANEITVLRTAVANIHVPTSALRTAGKSLALTGKLTGGLGLLITVYQYGGGQISGTEAIVDATFGAIGFMGPIGAAISITYFGEKYLRETYSNDTLFEKPVKK